MLTNESCCVIEGETGPKTPDAVNADVDQALPDLRPVMVHIRNLRTKIEEDPSQPQYLKTAWGKGYRFEVSRHRTKA